MATLMLGPYRFHGHAIVSADDKIADEAGTMPDSLRNPADWRRFQAALDEAVLVVLGRLSHVTSPNVRGRRRLILSHSVPALERREDGWWWNPSAADVPEALHAAAPEGGVIAVPGGRPVFDLFLQIGFDAFDLARANRVRLPGGVPIFSACADGTPADTVLGGAGLRREGREILDAAEDVEVALWRREGA